MSPPISRSSVLLPDAAAAEHDRDPAGRKGARQVAEHGPVAEGHGDVLELDGSP